MATTSGTRSTVRKTATVSASKVDFAASAISNQRIPVTVDPLSAEGAVATDLLPFRTAAVSRVFVGLQDIGEHLTTLSTLLGAPTLPGALIGSLAQPNGTSAAHLQVQFDPSTVGRPGPVTSVVTADDAGFTLALPSGVSMPDAGLTLVVHGANGNASITIPPAQIAANGLVGVLTLPTALAPLPVSILGALEALIPTAPPATQTPDPTPAALPQVTLGDNDTCTQSFKADATVDTFPYGVFYRLVEPQMSVVNKVFEFRLPSGRTIPLPNYLTGIVNAEVSSYTDRVPVEQPLSADGFLDQIAGIDPNGVFTADEKVPMAATLGLGYVLWMSQQWAFKGLGLGDLVYSLPLAPGEQTEVAIFEREDTAQVFESESFSEQQAEEQFASSDSSTLATFNSAFNETVNAGSSFNSSSSSESFGISNLLFSGGAGGSQSSGSTAQWLQGQRDTAQEAAQTTQSSAENQAAARRSANRTGMRLASATESESVTTKTITNHNHTRALTMQYWQVLRTFDVTTAIEGMTFTCLVPMQIVRFMPPGQVQTLTNPNQLSTRPEVIGRYANIIKHLDVLQRTVPRQYQHGLTLLSQFAGDPSAVPDTAGGVAEDVIRLTLTGTFVPCETVSIVAVTNRNTRIGPVQLSSTENGVDSTIPQDKFASQDELVAWLLSVRQSNAAVELTGSLALPPTLNRSDIVGFEITRSWNLLSYTLISQATKVIDDLEAGTETSAELFAAVFQTASSSRPTVTLTPSQLETALNGPALSRFSAFIEEFDANGNIQATSSNETYANDPLDNQILPLRPYPVPALQIAPVLRYNQLLEIERVAQHVVRNTTSYSNEVWRSLTPTERAILLDGYTIGVPPDGVSDASQLIPLLNCVQNRVLGYFGNSMIMPFMIPQAAAEQMKLDVPAIQAGLLAYQRATFAPPQSTIALPTQGVLGEAVLGHCPSAERIDLTRFWNWQDSPSDAAPAISPVTLPTTSPSIAGGLTAPNSLTQLPSLINNVLTAPVPSSGLAQSLASTSQPDFSAGLTGAALLESLQQNSQGLANTARAQALQSATQINSQQLATAGNLVGGLLGNPTAGSTAASAVTGKGSSETTKTKKTTSKKKDSKADDDSSSDGGSDADSSGGDD